jgi:hypothetical protein
MEYFVKLGYRKNFVKLKTIQHEKNLSHSGVGVNVHVGW